MNLQKHLLVTIMTSKTNVALIGFMGCGKSTVGRALARKLKYSFVDTDDEIEILARTSISKIFEIHGEGYFRKLEAEVLSKVLVRENTVIATGGGIVKNKENVDQIKEVASIVYLEATSETIYGNVKNSTHRPLLNCEKPLDKIKELLEDRIEIYRNSCDFIVNVDKTETNENVDSIIHLIGN